MKLNLLNYNCSTSYVSFKYSGQASFLCPVSRKQIYTYELKNGSSLIIKQFIEDFIAINEQIEKGIATKGEPKPWFICPFSGEIINDPVTVSTGVTYDRKALIGAFKNNAEQIQCIVTGKPINLGESLNDPSITIKHFIEKIDLEPSETKRTGAQLAHFSLAVGNAIATRTNQVKKPVALIFMLIFVSIARLMSKMDPNEINPLLSLKTNPHPLQNQPFFWNFKEKSKMILKIVEKSEITDYELGYLKNLLWEKKTFGLLSTEASNRDWETPLIVAARRGKLNMLEMLLDHGALIDKRSSLSYRNALDEAAINSRLEIIDRLLEAGADVNARDCLGATALHKAAIANQLASIDKLLTVGATIDSQDEDGFTPLMSAAFNGHIAAVENC